MRRDIERLNGWRRAGVCGMCECRSVYCVNGEWRLCYKCDAPPNAVPSWYAEVARGLGEGGQS